MITSTHRKGFRRLLSFRQAQAVIDLSREVIDGGRPSGIQGDILDVTQGGKGRTDEKIKRVAPYVERLGQPVLVL